MLYFDQLSTISRHLNNIKNSISTQSNSTINRINRFSKNLLNRFAGASNAFAEGSASAIPLFVRVDTQSTVWYKERLNQDIPNDYVLPVPQILTGSSRKLQTRGQTHGKDPSR